MTNASLANADLPSLLIVYDGACLFCSRYVAMLKLREQFEVELLSARTSDPRLSEFISKGYQLDEGMVLQIDTTVYVGADAMHQLALISTHSGVLNRVQRFVFSRKWLSNLLYPWLRRGRRLLLALRGTPLIKNSRAAS
ncbi:MAG: DCC1-like thiol-disulfide oxidoreductase family protein [Burkholderiaceae bacterium]|jgi:predicted DCC family thiol-disulfide oxidoreductase YuxK